MTTPWQPMHEDPTAVMGRRVVAYLIDVVIVAALLIVVFAMVATSEEFPSSAIASQLCEEINDPDGNSGFVCVNAGSTVLLADDGDMRTILLVGLIYFLGTQVILPTLTGFSPGKALVGLRIVNKETFAKAGFGANLLRWLLWIVDSFPWFLPLVGLVTGLFTKGHRRVGDMAASTLVIDRKWIGQPLPVPGANTVALAATAASPSVGSTAPPPPPGGAATSPPPPSPAPFAPPATTPAPLVAPPTSPPPPAVGADQTTVFGAPIVEPASAPPMADVPSADQPPPPQPPSETAAEVRPGIDAPQWDEARDTYIQWDPDRAEWMEWSESTGAWIPISQ